MFKSLKNKLSSHKKTFVKKYAKKLLSIVVSTIVSTCLSLLIHYNTLDSNLADLGFTKAQIVVANSAKKNHNMPRALELYNKVKEKNNKYSFHAAVMAGQILEQEYSDYTEAWNNYKYAMKCDDIIVLKQCLRFIIEQNDMIHNNYSESLIKMESQENAELITILLNKMYRLDPSISELLNIEFPIDDDQTKKILSPDMKRATKTDKWEYVSTITSNSSTKAYTTANEKVILIDSWEEPTDTPSFTTVRIYKYFKYNRVESTETNNLKEILTPYVKFEDSLYLFFEN